MQNLRVALVAMGENQSLALRNLATYVRTNPVLAKAIKFHLMDMEKSPFDESRGGNVNAWSFNSAYDVLLRDLIDFQPDLIGFSCYLWNIEHVLKLVPSLRRVLPQTLQLLGGPNAGPLAESLLETTCVDFVVNGDGEIPFERLLKALVHEGSVFDDVPSLGYRRHGEIAHNAPDPSDFDIDKLAGVYELYPFEPGRSHVLYETQRGCPYRCRYCMYGNRPAAKKNTDLVVRELDTLLKSGRKVYVVDPSFGSDKKRAKDILRRLPKEHYTGALYIETHPDSLDRELAQRLSDAPIDLVALGIQTISETGCKQVGRQLRLDRFTEAIGNLQHHDIPFYVDVIYGLPGTNVDDFLETLSFLYSLEVTSIFIYRLLGLPGTPIVRDAEQEGLVFSPTPPYELLCSSTFSLDDLLFCGSLVEKLSTILSPPKCDAIKDRFGKKAFPMAFLKSLYDLYLKKKVLDIEDAIRRGPTSAC